MESKSNPIQFVGYHATNLDGFVEKWPKLPKPPHNYEVRFGDESILHSHSYPTTEVDETLRKYLRAMWAKRPGTLVTVQVLTLSQAEAAIFGGHRDWMSNEHVSMRLPLMLTLRLFAYV